MLPKLAYDIWCSKHCFMYLCTKSHLFFFKHCQYIFSVSLTRKVLTSENVYEIVTFNENIHMKKFIIISLNEFAFLLFSFCILYNGRSCYFNKDPSKMIKKMHFKIYFTFWNLVPHTLV